MGLLKASVAYANIDTLVSNYALGEEDIIRCLACPEGLILFPLSVEGVRQAVSDLFRHHSKHEILISLPSPCRPGHSRAVPFTGRYWIWPIQLLGG